MLNSIKGLNDFTLKISRNLLLIGLSAASLWMQQSCRSTRHSQIRKQVDKQLNSALMGNHNIGLLVFDPISKDTLYSRTGSHYFVPASNVKIFTLYSALRLLPQEMPTIKYRAVGDTLYFEGLGNPATLHPYFNDSTALQLLSKYSVLFLNSSNFMEPRWPAGWAWEDFDQSYAPERSSLPLYGNVAMLHKKSGTKIRPEYFQDSLSSIVSDFNRSRHRNYFHFTPDRTDTLEIPLNLRSGLSAELLEYNLGKKVHTIQELPPGKKELLTGISRDSILKRMMWESDNFLAEQILLGTSSVLSDTLSSLRVIDHMIVNELSGLKQPPRWVDGSGLSRYNKFTPGSMVFILKKLYSEFGEEYILNFFPEGGVSGTLRDHFKGSPQPFVYAKSGSMSNIYCLSGYLKSKSGKLLIFSYMNNNFMIGSEQLKAKMQAVLELIRDLN